MSRTRHFLDRDTAARAALITALAVGATAVVATQSPAGPGPGGALSAPGRTLVAMSRQADQVERVSEMLSQSTRRCLVDQGRMLGDLAKGGGREVLERRADDLQADRADNEGFPLADTVLKTKGLNKDTRERLQSLASIREMCLSWADRSMDLIGEKLAKGGPDLAEVRKAAFHDSKWTDTAIAWHDRGSPMQASDIETVMHTYGPRP